ncbi:MAG TPA: bacillithiol biosynthesis cysteine-adding enzyme BshC [Candidatus Dormibacteraeota bacterium]|nr:bacillithiol biosynthesis cysteine-adding enzyme BshC [Candidatus Dormibacteraeota bacterium]
MKAHCLPFSQIPHTTPLFTDFLSYSPKVHLFYPRSPFFKDWLKEEAEKISCDSSRRERVTAILERQNKSWDASPQTLANLNRLREGAVAVVTGQQVGLFGGPMFSIYKALTAVKLAQEATAAGVDAVPIFWLATYDHDLAEVNHVSIPGADGALQILTTPSHDVPGAQVGAVRFGDEITPLVDQAVALLGDTEGARFLRDSYRPGETMGTAFARFYARVFADWGVIVLDASDAELAHVAEPIYRAAVERAGELSAALLERGKALEAAGYHQQVKVTDSSVLLFTTRHGARTPISRRSSGEFVIDGEPAAEKLSQSELLAEIGSNPEHFSPNVLLRPIVQDYLLPTLAYTGGAAEAAYFAQAGVVYQALLGRVTPVLPRFSATIVEPKLQRLLEKHGLSAGDVFNGPDALRQEIAARNLPNDLQAAFETAKESFDSNFDVVKQKLEKLDRTLVDAAETARSKMQHQMEKLYSQAARAEAQKGELVSRHTESLNHALYPDKGLQERTIGGIYFLARYGRDLLHQLHDTIHSDCHDHQIIEL